MHILNKFYNKIHKKILIHRNKKLSMEEKYKIFLQIKRKEIDIKDIEYLEIDGHATSFAPTEEYILIESIVDMFNEEPYFQVEQLGIWVSGRITYRELLVENGKLIYKYEIKPN